MNPNNSPEKRQKVNKKAPRATTAWNYFTLHHWLILAFSLFLQCWFKALGFEDATSPNLPEDEVKHIYLKKKIVGKYIEPIFWLCLKDWA